MSHLETDVFQYINRGNIQYTDTLDEGHRRPKPWFNICNISKNVCIRLRIGTANSCENKR